VGGEVEGERGILLDQQDAHLLLLVDAAQDAEDLDHDQRRQAERRLVEQHQARLQHQRARDRQHLLLAARQRAGLLLDALLEPREIAEDAVALGGDHALVPVGVGRDAQILVDRQRGEGAAALGHVSDPEPHDLLGRHADQVLAGEADAAFAAHHVADRPERRRLARAVGAQQGGDAAFGDVEAHVVERLGLAVKGLQSLHFEQRQHHEVPR
jgi:hypothetical protein